MASSADAVEVAGYRTLLKLASGGMGTVFVARHAAARGVERLVVLKRIHPHLLEDRAVAGMLVDEARTSSQIRHPNVVPVDDAIEQGGELLLVQAFIESIDLASLIKAAVARGERLPPAVVSRIVGDALAGLDGAHRAVDLRGRPLEIIHRDVSPHNVIVGTDGRSRLIDFGIAHAARRITVTESGVLKGKIPYMAPEQLRRQPLDARADVFSAGVMLYEALAGRRPFLGEDEADTLLSILMAEPEPLSSVVPDLPPSVDAVIERALARDRDARFEDAAAMHDALDHVIAPAPPRDVAAIVERLVGETIAARRARIRAALDALDPTEAAARAPDVDVERVKSAAAEAHPEPVERVSPTRMSSRAITAMAAIALVVGAAGAFLRWSAKPSPRGDNEPPPRALSSPTAPTSPAGSVAPQPQPQLTEGAQQAPPATTTIAPRASAKAPSGAAPRPSVSAPPPKPSGDLHKNPYAPSP